MQRRRSATWLARLVLVSVLLNLADWPYVDEIVDGVALASQASGHAATVSDHSKQPVGSDSKVAVGYQLLLQLQAVPLEPLHFTAAPPAKASPVKRSFVLLLVPPRIDRPPISGIPS